MSPDIYTYVKQQEEDFETRKIKVGDNWDWSFRDHVQLIFHLMNGKFFTGDNDWIRAFKNIMKPIRNLAKWSEDIEVKDIIFYIENETGRVLSFLIKKYHDEVYVKENNVDTMLDNITLSDLDYGGALVQPTNKIPEVIPLQRIAFCDQTDILGGPIGYKFNFSPDKLRAMSKRGWGLPLNGATITIDELITLAQPETKNYDNKEVNNVSGKNIEVYVVKGSLPENYLKNNNNMENYYEQNHIIAFYTDKDNKKEGVTLYRKKSESDLLFHATEPVENRALGSGEGETLLHPQIWTNWITIHKHNMLEAASKSPLWTDDDEFANKNAIGEQENLTLNYLQDGKQVGLIPTINATAMQLFSNDEAGWYENGQLNGSAQDPIIGKEAPSGTTFRGQERSIQQNQGLHKMRRGQRAKFIEEIYRKIIIPDMVKEIKNGKKFLATLSSDEITWVIDQLVTNEVNKKIIAMALNGEEPTEEEIAVFSDLTRQEMGKKGNKHLLEILKGEFEGAEVKMGINVAGKQKDLAGMSDNILSIVQFLLANPVPPYMQKPVNEILEYSGLSPADFSTVLKGSLQSPIQPMQGSQSKPALTPKITATV